MITSSLVQIEPIKTLTRHGGGEEVKIARVRGVAEVQVEEELPPPRDTGLNGPMKSLPGFETKRSVVEGEKRRRPRIPFLRSSEQRPAVDQDHHHDELDRGARDGMVESGGDKGEGFFGKAALDGDSLVKLRRVVEKTLQILIAVEDQLGDGHGDGLDQGRLRLSGRLG